MEIALVKKQTFLTMKQLVSLSIFYFALVTQLAHATIKNTVSVYGTAPGGPANQFFADADEEVSVAPANSSLSIVKSATLNDTNNDGVAGVNEVITYTFDVTNNGNVTLQNVQVNDTINATNGPVMPASEVVHDDASPLGDSDDSTSGPDGVWDSLAPGDTIRFTASYTVTQNDLDTLN